MYNFFKKIDNTEKISLWESKVWSNEIIKPRTTPNNRLAPELNYFINKIEVEFNGSCLKQEKITYIHGTIVNIYIVDKLSPSLNSSDFVLQNRLFGAINLTKNANIDKYKYSKYGIGFDAKETFSFPSSGFAQHVIIFGTHISSYVHVNNKKKNSC